MWDGALKKYDARIDRVESQITSTLRDKLATAKNANEMFRVFSKFNALFVRPRVSFKTLNKLMCSDQRSYSRISSTIDSSRQTRFDTLNLIYVIRKISLPYMKNSS